MLKSHNRNRLFGGVAALALTFALTNGPLSAAEKTENFTIGTQSVSSALVELATQSKVRIMASGSDISNITTPGVSGTMTLDDALKKLLEGTKLSYFRMNDGAIIVKKQPEKREAEEKSGKKPAENSFSDGNASLSGHVTEMNAGGNLAGALVRIFETGQTTKTDDLGNFYFPSITPGNYTLSISYLGFASRITEVTLGKGEEFREEYSLGKALGDLDEIVVFGSRSARALALNLQRTAENNSEVISADMLGNFTGTTISEALRRVSGVAFQRNSLTGDGQNIYIRGLAPEMNAIKLNGLNLPVGSGTGRAADLSTLLADSVAKITIHKSLLPSHDSTGTGGLVEIETKSPLNRPHRYINLSVEGERKGGDFRDGVLVSGTVAGTFGADENFGLSASVQYRKRNIKNFSYDAPTSFGQYLPLLEPNGPFTLAITRQSEVDPLVAFPFEPGADSIYVSSIRNNLSEMETSNLTITLSAEWQVADHTNLNIDYQRSTADNSSYSRTNTFITPHSYKRMAVEALGGEERWALAWDGSAQTRDNYAFSKSKQAIDNYSIRGATRIDKWDFNYTLGYNRGSSRQDPSTSISSLIDSFMVDEGFISPAAYDAVEGRVISLFGERTGRGYPLPLLTDAGWAFVNDPANHVFQQGTISRGQKGYNDRYTAKFSGKYKVDGKYLKYVEVGIDYETSKFGFGITSPVYSIGRPKNCQPFDFFCEFSPAPTYTLADVGLNLEEANLAPIGISGQGFSVIKRADIEAFIDNIPSLTEGDNPFLQLAQSGSAIFDTRDQDAFTKEKSLSGYLQTRIDIGKLEIIGGVRINRVAVQSFKLSSPQIYDENDIPDLAFAAQYEQLDELNGHVTDVLPRFQFNYHQNDNLVFRASYALSVARPSIEQLSAKRQISLRLGPRYGPDGDQPLLELTESNPDLKPANTHNFDGSIEYYHDDIGLIKLSGFYKRTTNQLETNARLRGEPGVGDIDLPDIPEFQEELPEDLFISRRRPENSADPATIWGIEAHIERQFTFLPGFWNGFGVYANYNFTKSAKKDTYAWFSGPALDDDGNYIPGTSLDASCFCYVEDGTIQRKITDIDLGSVSYNNAPRHSGTVALTYNKHDIDATMTYGFQGRYTGRFVANNLLKYGGGAGTLDFRISYYFDAGQAQYRLFFEGQDLLKNAGSSDLETVLGGTGVTPKIYTGARYLGGRSFRLGLSATF